MMDLKNFNAHIFTKYGKNVELVQYFVDYKKMFNENLDMSFMEYFLNLCNKKK